MKYTFSQIFRKELKGLNVTVVRKRFVRRMGEVSYLDDGTFTIKVPSVTDVFNLGVAFHEIGHVKLKHKPIELDDLDYSSEVRDEYHAERFAISKLRQYGFHLDEYRDEYRRYVKRAKEYVCEHIVYEHKKRKIKKVPQYIKDWLGEHYTKLRIRKL